MSSRSSNLLENEPFGSAENRSNFFIYLFIQLAHETYLIVVAIGDGTAAY